MRCSDELCFLASVFTLNVFARLGGQQGASERVGSAFIGLQAGVPRLRYHVGSPYIPYIKKLCLEFFFCVRIIQN